ncbi:ABC transporter ATP-binding protein [Ectobacillus polymachus]|uniref:ABC transporter ATP-binding protein n=1 Tax=Ectobacillus polymachus TaxID=1508806 RepID=UPI003A84F268
MIEVKQLKHSFHIGRMEAKQTVQVLDNISFSAQQGEILSIVGRSGSGKSTLLHLLSGFISPDSGSILINGIEVTSFSEKQWAQFRLQHLGFIFQNFQLIPGLTAYENVEMPLILKEIPPKMRREEVKEILKQVGLDSYGDFYPKELSGGQQQRVGIARALITKPDIILADEPTGSLDSETEADILQLITELNEERKITFIIITHDIEVASISTRQLQLVNGSLLRGDYIHEA